jgi:hypothetical protein
MKEMIEGWLIEIENATEGILDLLPQPIDPRAKFCSLVALPSGYQLTLATNGGSLILLGFARATEQGCAGIKWGFVGKDSTYELLKCQAGDIQRGGETLQ